MLRTKRALFAMAMVLPLAGLSGCYMEVSDAGADDRADNGTRLTHPDDLPTDLRGKASTCEEQQSPDGRWTWYCYQNDDYTWRTSCKSDQCQEVKVFAHYMLEEDMGTSRVVHVEAFDNEYFQGAPAGQVRIANFAARRGEWRDAQLFLEPGEYYLRAYMTTNGDDVVPYSLGDMTLVSDQPVGVFGALSGAEMVRVAPRHQDRYPEPVHIYLDKMFKKPGTEPDTNARLRLNFTIADDFTAPDRKQVLVRLHESRDLAASPAAEFSMASELFLVSGRVGKAEFLSPSLELGDYLVFAFIDANGNSSYDTGELAALHTVNGIGAAVSIEKDRTETLNLTLSAADVPVNP